MRTDAVSGDKLRLPLRPVKGGTVAVHTLLAAVSCRFATWVLNLGTESGTGQLHRSEWMMGDGAERSLTLRKLPSVAEIGTQSVALQQFRTLYDAACVARRARHY